MPSNARQTISLQTRQNLRIAHFEENGRPRGVPRAPKLERDVNKGPQAQFQDELLYYAETTPKLRNHGTTSAPPDYIEGSKISPKEEYICLGYAKASKGYAKASAASSISIRKRVYYRYTALPSGRRRA